MVIFAVKVTLVPAQIGPEGAATIFIVGNTVGITFITILFETTTAGEAHVALDVRVHVIISPLFNVVDENVFELAPVLIPFICH